MAALLFVAGAFATTERIEARVSSRPSATRQPLVHPQIRITSNGRSLLHQAVPACSVCRIDLTRDIRVVDVDGDGRLDVTVALRTGTGSCCTWLDVFWRRGDRFVVSTRSFSSCTVAPRDLDRDGRAEVVACDSRFTGRFAAIANSPTPVRIWRFARGRFDLVTPLFRPAVREDAARLWRTVVAYRAARRDVRGAVAAWTADELSLGQGAEAWRRVERLRSAGGLAGTRGPVGAAYVAFLRRQLYAMGYGR